MPVHINDRNLILSMNKNTNLFHLSYDKKDGIDSTTLKKEIVWEILINQADSSYYLDSPNETTIVFESQSSYIWWFKKLVKCFDNKMCFELTESRTSETERDTHYFHANEYPCIDKTTFFNENFVTPVRNVIDNEENPTTKCP